MNKYCIVSLLFFLQSLVSVNAGLITGFLESTEDSNKIYNLEIRTSSVDELKVGEAYKFKVGLGDQTDHYLSREIEAAALFYNNQWHLEKIFPTEGIGAKAYYDSGEKFHRMVATMSRRHFVKEGEYVKPFAGINQDGEFFQIKEFLGKAYVINFIFTRCQAAEMCPAATQRMAYMQEKAEVLGLEDLHFLSVSFDPKNDSPGVLRQYAESYSIELDNFTFMTSKPEWIDDLMRYFGIIRLNEDGTINHTMATLLIDQKGRVHFRKEGSTWRVDDFLEQAEELLR